MGILSFAGGAKRAAKLGLAWLGIMLIGGQAEAARVCEGPGINHRPASVASPDVLSVLAYNVYMLPTHVRSIPTLGSRFATGQEERAEIIPTFVAPYDVIIFAEAYDDGARAILLEGLRANGFPYSTHILGTAYSAASSRSKDRVYQQPKPLSACADPNERPDCDDPATVDDFATAGEGDIGIRTQDGGVFIASRHPITEAKELVYEACDGLDCNASKGFVYARVDKAGTPYHVIGTHAQFGWGNQQRAMRRAQLRAIWNFVVNESGIPQDEAVVIGGDFNVFRSEVDNLANPASLGVHPPRLLGHRFTRETRNDWVSRGNGYVDYVLTKDEWRQPHYSANCPMIFRSLYDYEDAALFTTYSGQDVCDLSDHYAVWGYFDYREAAVDGPDCPVPEFPGG